MLIVSADKQKMKAGPYFSGQACRPSECGAFGREQTAIERAAPRQEEHTVDSEMERFHSPEPVLWRSCVSVLLSNEESETVTDHTADLPIDVAGRL